MRITACSVPVDGRSFDCANTEQHSALKIPLNTSIRLIEFSCGIIRAPFGSICQSSPLHVSPLHVSPLHDSQSVRDRALSVSVGRALLSLKSGATEMLLRSGHF